MKQIRTFLPLAALIFSEAALGQGANSAAAPGAAETEQGTQPPPAARVVDLKASDGTLLKATYFAAAKPGGPANLLISSRLWEIRSRTYPSWSAFAS